MLAVWLACPVQCEWLPTEGSRMQPTSTSQDNTPFDATRKFVRVTGEPKAGLVAFEFSIGWPELAVDLVLPQAAFDEFCLTHRVQRLDA